MSRKCLFNLALFASLALNVFFVGNLTSGTYERVKALSPTKRIASYAETLPEPKRSQALAIIADYKPKIDARISTLKRDRNAVQDAMKNPDYSRNDIETKMATMRESVTAMQATVGDMLLDISEHLSPEERAKLLPPRMKILGGMGEAKPPHHDRPKPQKD